MSWPWSQLGLSGPASLSEVRHAYAEKLKVTHPEDDPEGFQRLHSAYQLASRMARQRQRQEQARPAPQVEEQEPERPREPEDLLYEQLLQGGRARPRPVQEKEEEQDFDFDELLQGGGERPRLSREEDEEEDQDFDFDELLQDEEPPPRVQEEEKQDFDFERLFAEGEAERAEARRRRAEERRRAQARWKAQEQARERERQKAREWTQKREQWQRREEQKANDQQRRDRFDQEQVQWQNTETILHTIDMLYHARAEEKAWENFFQSPLFQLNKGSVDLIFGLEDFVSARGDLPQKIRVALFLAYGFDKGVSRPELQPLYQMLLPAWKAEQGEARQKKLHNIGIYIGGLLLAPVALFLLATGWFFSMVLILGAAVFVLPKLLFTREGPGGKRKLNLKFIWLLALGIFTYVCFDQGWSYKFPLSLLAVGLACWVLRSMSRMNRRDEKSGGRPRNKRDERWVIIVTAACLAVGISMLFMPELEKGLDRLIPSRDPREQVCRYLEEDFGVPFQSIYNITELERHANVFAPVGDVGSMFLAGPDGTRDVSGGKRGYTTNYPDMMMLWAMEDFAKKHNLQELDLVNRNQNLADWETSGTYLIVLPFYGAGETITDLGECLEKLSQKEWYRRQPPGFELVLCSEQFEEGRLILQEYLSSDGAFDAESVRELYESSFAHSYCAQLLKECGLDRDGENGSYAMTNEGFTELKGETCCKLYGVTEDEQVAVEYYVNVSGGALYCLPAGFWESGGAEEDIRLDQVIHRKNGQMVTVYQSGAG